MPGALPYSQECCTTCDDPNVQNIPGPAGSNGLDGAAGAAGQNAYTTTTAQFSQPDGTTPGSETVSVSVVNTDWMAVGQILFIPVGGHYEVDSITDSTTVVLKNLEDGSGVYTGNAPNTTPISTSSPVVVAGLQGPSTAASGAAGGDLSGTYPNPLLGITTTEGDIILHNGTQNGKLARGTDKQVLHSDDGATDKLAYRDLDLSGTNTSTTGAVPIANGGTGQTAQTAAFDALAPTTTKGDVTVHNGTDNIRVGVSATDGGVFQELASETSGTKFDRLAPINFGPSAEEVTVETIIMRETQVSGTNGKTSLSDTTWHSRLINQVSVDTEGLVTTATHTKPLGFDGTKFTLQQGYYRIRVDAVAYNCGKHQIRLFNVTDGGVALYAGGANTINGLVVTAPTTESTVASLEGEFHVDQATEEYAIEHWVATGTGSFFGHNASTGTEEVYLTVRLEKIAKAG